MLATLLLGASVGFSANQVMLQNESCQFSLDNDLYVSASHTILRDGATELWRISSDGTLSIQGEVVTTDSYSNELLQQYHQGVYSQTQNVVEVVIEAIDIANFAVGTVMGEMFGRSGKKQITSLQQAISHELSQVISQDDEYLVVRGSALDTFGDNLDAAIEAQMDDLVANSIGSVLIQVGKSLLTGSGSFDDRIASFEQRMEAMAADVEAEIELRAAALEERAEGMCVDVQHLTSIEEEIAQRVPGFTEHRLFHVPSAE